jgi:hypothetical protein
MMNNEQGDQLSMIDEKSMMNNERLMMNNEEGSMINERLMMNNEQGSIINEQWAFLYIGFGKAYVLMNS